MTVNDFSTMFKAGIPACGIKCPACGIMLIRPDQAGSDDPVPAACPGCGQALEYYKQPDDFGMFEWWNARAKGRKVEPGTGKRRNGKAQHRARRARREDEGR